jgi:hypothetical protein
MKRREFLGGAARVAVPLALGREAVAQVTSPGRDREAYGSVATVALHYMTWLDDSLWPFAGTQPILDPQHPVPQLYRSGDPAVIRRHNADAARRGFAWLWSWWGRGNEPGGDSVLRAYLEDDAGSPVQLVILYEATGVLSAGRDGLISFDDPANFRTFVEDMAYLDQQYFSHPRYAHRFLRVDGRAAVFQWASRIFTGAWPAAVAAARREASFFLIGGEFSMDLREDGQTPLVRGDLAEAAAPLDAVSGYGIYDPRFVPPSGHLDASYAARYERVVRGWPLILGQVAPHAAFIPPLQFAFDDRRYRPQARNPPLTSDLDEAVAVARVTRSLLDDAAAGDPRYRNVLPIVVCVSWNEHVEGSAVEWTVQHGYQYLQALSVSLRA